MAKAERPTALLDHFHTQLSTLERQVTSALDVWTDSDPAVVWAKSQVGIGPILAAGVCAHIDIERAKTAGAIWRFFGLDPTLKWGKGEKRPYNADAKVLAWKIGDSFVKVSGRDNAFYGVSTGTANATQLDRDESGGNAETAVRTLEERNIRDAASRAVYETGHLPAGRLDLRRGCRYATKLFLAHLHEVMYREHYGEEPPLPYPIAHLGDAHHIPAPR